MTRDHRAEEIFRDKQKANYEYDYENHPSTNLIRSLLSSGHIDPLISDILEYLLQRARDEDTGPPP